MRRVDQRALLGLAGEPVADAELPHRGDQLLGERLVDAVLHQQAVRAHAGLPGVAVLGRDRARDRGVEVGVVEHDERRVAAELERHLLHRLRALRHQQLADLGRAGERQLAHARIAVSTPPISRAGPVSTLNTPAGMPARCGELGERERGVGRLRRRLADDRAAGGERGRDLARDHRRREIPRRDRGDDADRLAQHHDALVGLVARDQVAVDALGFLGEPLDEGGGIGDLALRLGERLALLGGHEPREVVRVQHDQVVPAAQEHRALLRGLRGPGREGGVRGGDGLFGRGGIERGHGAELAPVAGIVHGQCRAARRVEPLAVHEALLPEQRRILELEPPAGRGGCRQWRASGSLHDALVDGAENRAAGGIEHLDPHAVAEREEWCHWLALGQRLEHAPLGEAGRA